MYVLGKQLDQVVVPLRTRTRLCYGHHEGIGSQLVQISDEIHSSFLLHHSHLVESQSGYG